jgi:hypothetical protein
VATCRTYRAAAWSHPQSPYGAWHDHLGAGMDLRLDDNGTGTTTRTSAPVLTPIEVRPGRRRRRGSPGQGHRHHGQRRAATPAAGDVPGRRPRPWSPAPISSSRPGRGPGSPWPTSSRPCSAARKWWWPPPPRPCRTSWPRRTCPWWSRRAGRPGLLRRAQGTQQLHLPPAGGRGGARRHPARPGRQHRCRASERAGRHRDTPPTTRARRPGRRGPDPAGLVGDDDERRPGRADLRAQRPGVGHGQRRPPRVPRGLQLPLGQPVLRRGGPRPGGGRRRGGGQHPSVRGPPGQRGLRAARP